MYIDAFWLTMLLLVMAALWIAIGILVAEVQKWQIKYETLLFVHERLQAQRAAAQERDGEVAPDAVRKGI